MRMGTGGKRRRARAAGWWSTIIVERRAREWDRHRFRPAPLPLEDRRLLSTFDVTSTADDGSTGTLRWAIAQANAASPPSTIDFEFGSSPATITLTQGPLELSNIRARSTIDGPGRTCDHQRQQCQPRVPGGQGVTASISGLTITGGSAIGFGRRPVQRRLGHPHRLHDQRQLGRSNGGGLDNRLDGTFTDCTISGNSAGDGGGLYNTTGTFKLTDCTISGNTAEGGGGLDNSGDGHAHRLHDQRQFRGRWRRALQHDSRHGDFLPDRLHDRRQLRGVEWRWPAQPRLGDVHVHRLHDHRQFREPGRGWTVQ